MTGPGLIPLGNELRRFDVRGGEVVAQDSHLTSSGRLRVAVARGSDLLVAQDPGTGATIYRLPLGPPVPRSATSSVAEEVRRTRDRVRVLPVVR